MCLHLSTVVLERKIKCSQNQNHMMISKTTPIPPLEEFPAVGILLPIQRRYWDIAVTSDEFMNAQTKREQIGIINEMLCKDKTTGFTHDIAASMFGISRAAFEKHIKKYENGVQKPGKPKILNEGQISDLAKWLEDHIAVEDWPSYSDIDNFCAEKFDLFIMRNTMVKFMRREFKQFKFVKAKPMDSKRLKAPVDSIDSYYAELSVAMKDVDYRFCFNLDETGEDEKTDTHSIDVCVPVEIDPEIVMIPLERCSKRFSILHTISTDGKYFKPFIIVPRKTLEGDIYKFYNPEDVSRIRYQEHGFMTEALFMEFMVKFFLPELQRKREKFEYSGKALLIMDNLVSHTNVINKLGLNAYPNKYNLEIKWLPPHTSDQTQALDLGLFGIQKNKSQNIKNCDGLSKFNNRINKALQGLHQASTQRNIVSAFKSAGITRIPGETSDSPIILQVNTAEARAIRHLKRKEHETAVNIDGVDTTKAFPVIKLTVCEYAKAKAKKTKETRMERIKKYQFTTTDRLVAEAISAYATEEKPFVSSKKINQFLFKYCEEIKQPKFIGKYVHDALDRFQQYSFARRKKNSYELTAIGIKKLKEAEKMQREKEKLEKSKKKEVSAVEDE